MTLRTATLTIDRPSVRQRAMDYLALGKPRVVVMVLAVTVAGFYMAKRQWPIRHGQSRARARDQPADKNQAQRSAGREYCKAVYPVRHPCLIQGHRLRRH